MVSSDGSGGHQPVTSMAFMEEGTVVDSDGQVTMATQQDAAILQQGQITTQYTVSMDCFKGVFGKEHIELF